MQITQSLRALDKGTALFFVFGVVVLVLSTWYVNAMPVYCRWTAFSLAIGLITYNASDVGMKFGWSPRLRGLLRSVGMAAFLLWFFLSVGSLPPYP